MTLKIGDSVEVTSLPAVTAEQLRNYAAASGDNNPIHLDESVAKSVGLPGIIAHGMLTAGFLAERAAEFARGNPDLANSRLKSFQTRFKAMTMLGDVISVGGSVRAVTASDVTLELQAKNQKGEVTTTGIAVFSF